MQSFSAMTDTACVNDAFKVIRLLNGLENDEPL